MRQEKMSVTQALSELKMLGKRIEGEIGSSIFIAVRIPNASLTKEQIEERIRASYQSVKDLIDRRNAIKAAVVMSNANTTLTIAGKEYTVTQAIDAKKYAMAYQASLVQAMSAQLKAANKEFDTRMANVERAALEITQKTVSSSSTPVTGAELKDLNTYKSYIELNQVEMIDPLDLPNTVKKLADEVEKFLLDVDTALSIANATTFIDVTYGCDCPCHAADNGGADKAD